MRGVAQINIADGDDPVAGVELVGGGGGGAAKHVLDEDAGEGGRVGAFRRLQLAPHYGDAQALSPHKQNDQKTEAEVLHEPYSAKAGQRSSHTRPPG